MLLIPKISCLTPSKPPRSHQIFISFVSKRKPNNAQRSQSLIVLIALVIVLQNFVTLQDCLASYTRKKKNKHLNLKRPKQSVTTKNEYKKSLVPRLVYMSKTHVNMILMYTDCISIKPTPDSLDPCYGNVHKSVENTIHCIKLLAIQF